VAVEIKHSLEEVAHQAKALLAQRGRVQDRAAVVAVLLRLALQVPMPTREVTGALVFLILYGRGRPRPMVAEEVGVAQILRALAEQAVERTELITTQPPPLPQRTQAAVAAATVTTAPPQETDLRAVQG
jgi:hypothetical protein